MQKTHGLYPIVSHVVVQMERQYDKGESLHERGKESQEGDKPGVLTKAVLTSFNERPFKSLIWNLRRMAYIYNLFFLSAQKENSRGRRDGEPDLITGCLRCPRLQTIPVSCANAGVYQKIPGPGDNRSEDDLKPRSGAPGPRAACLSSGLIDWNHSEAVWNSQTLHDTIFTLHKHLSMTIKTFSW